MTAKEIAQIIESPEKCTTSDFLEIEKLAVKYPYAQTFPILLLQHLGKSKSLEFEDQLNKYAYKISDRAQLYFLINKDSGDQKQEFSEPIPVVIEETIEQETELTIVSEEQELTATIEEEIDEVRIDETSEIIEEELDVAPVEIETSEASIRSDVDINPDEDMLDFKVVEVEEMTFDPVTIDFDDDEIKSFELDDPIDETPEISIEKEPEVTSEDVKLEIVPEEIDEEIISENEGSEIILEKVEELIEEEIQKESFEKEEIELESHLPENSDKLEQHEDYASLEKVQETEIKSIEFFDPTAEILDQEITPEEELVSPSTFEEGKAISLDILSAEEEEELDEVTSNAIAAGYQIVEKEQEIEEEKETVEVVQEFEDKIAADKRSFTDWLKVSATTHSPEYQVKQQRTVEIVDRFIKDDPKITRISKQEEPEKKVAEFFKVATIAKESLNEEVMPVSETLAEIYQQQGNFGKAIDAYQQLLLLNPEKKSFFANQIKKLKKKIKN